MVLPIMMIATTASNFTGSCQTTAGSNNIPTETKNKTENASSSGSDSAAARWLNSDSRIIIPAKKAPRAKDTSNTFAAPNATPTAAAITQRVNNSREPVRATHQSTLGSPRRPTTSMNAMKAATLATVAPTVVQSSPAEIAAADVESTDARTPANAGNSTRTSTMTRSSTNSQPTAMRPLIDSSRPLASSR